MVRLSSILKKTCWGFVITASLTACIDKSKYQAMVSSMQWWNYLPMPSICILPQETSSLV